MFVFIPYEYFLYNKFENWNPSEFNWENQSFYLAKYCNKYFKIWWNPEKFNWQDSCFLIIYCNKYFKIWWNPEKFDLNKESKIMARYCNKYFKIWWNPDKFNWTEGSGYLVDYCIKYFSVWWDLNKAIKYFSDEDIEDLIKKNNEYNLLDKSEIIKLKLLRN